MGRGRKRQVNKVEVWKMDEYRPKGVIVVKDPEVAKLFSDQLRRQILHLITHKEMS